MSIDVVPNPFHGVWEGDDKIILGIDIGMTESGISFTYLQKGSQQNISRVTRWPGQDLDQMKSKVPSLVWYHANLEAVGFGAEVKLPTVQSQSGGNGWVLARYFKLNPHPREIQAKHILKVDDLPPGITQQQVYSDFLRYLLKNAKESFEGALPSGKEIWRRFSPNMDVVFTHPSGYGVGEQSFLRSIAVSAGLSTVGQASNRVQFTTEAEALVYFCLKHTKLWGVLRAGMNFAVCNAGDSMVETAIYSVTSSRPSIKFKEKRTSECLQGGAVFVDLEAEKYLRKTFANAGLDPKDVEAYTKAGVEEFEISTKRCFREVAADYTISFTGSYYNNMALGVRRGRMSISGSTVKSFFEGTLQEIIGSVDKQLDGLDVPYILLVGNYGDCPYVRDEFKKRYEPRGSQVIVTNDST